MMNLDFFFCEGGITGMWRLFLGFLRVNTKGGKQSLLKRNATYMI